MYLAKRGFKTI